MSHKKLNEVVKQYRKKPVKEALIQLRLSKKKPAKLLYDCVVNARNQVLLSSLFLFFHFVTFLSLLFSCATTTHLARCIRLGRRLYPRQAKEFLKLPTEQLLVSEIWVGKGKIFRKLKFRARGRADIQKIYHSHFRVTVRENEDYVPAAKLRERRLQRAEMRASRVDRRYDLMRKLGYVDPRQEKPSRPTSKRTHRQAQGDAQAVQEREETGPVDITP